MAPKGQNEMRPEGGMPLRVRLREGLSRTCDANGRAFSRLAVGITVGALSEHLGCPAVFVAHGVATGRTATYTEFEAQ